MVSRNVNKRQSAAMGIGEPFERLLPVFLVGVIQISQHGTMLLCSQKKAYPWV